MTFKLFLVALFTDLTMARENIGANSCLSSLTQVFNSAYSPTSLLPKGQNERQDV